MIQPADYRFLCELVLRNSGLHLGGSKEYLLESRLPPVAATLGLAGIDELIAYLKRAPTLAAIKLVCDAMTTGETLFFRDKTPFDAFRDVLLPEAANRARSTGRPIRIWSAACSTGQEVYSLAMIIEQLHQRLGSPRIEIVATDYSSATVARAKAGVFNQFEVQRGLPVQLLIKHFTSTERGYEVKPELRRWVTFKEHNLLTSFGGLGSFDIVFIRNVLIYFDSATKKDVLERASRQLGPGGCLVLGGTENTLGVTGMLTRDPSSPAPVYRLAGVTPTISGARVTPTVTAAPRSQITSAA